MKEDDWKEKLTEGEYRILREQGTEPAFSGQYVNHKEEGAYSCKACGHTLFSSKTKFESGSGWPSFYDVVDEKNITLKEDKSIGMKRIEVTCGNCGSHLGHVFEDGPKPTGKRYCINSLALSFEKE